MNGAGLEEMLVDHSVLKEYLQWQILFLLGEGCAPNVAHITVLGRAGSSEQVSWAQPTGVEALNRVRYV